MTNYPKALLFVFIIDYKIITNSLFEEKTDDWGKEVFVTFQIIIAGVRGGYLGSYPHEVKGRGENNKKLTERAI